MSNPADGVRCMLMRGGTSKGAFFVEADLPSSPNERDELLLRVMGTPDPRQVDGVGGAHPLTTKVAVVSPSRDAEADVDYLFLQPGVAEATITDRQNCGNMLAAVGQFALERGLVEVEDGHPSIRIMMRNTGGVAVSTFPVEGGRPVYDGETRISGVPGSAAEVAIEFIGVAGSSTGALLPTGNQADVIRDVDATLIDNGMPVVVLRAEDLGVSGYETCAELEDNSSLRAELEAIRLLAGPMMNLGEVSSTTIPKLTLVAPPIGDGAISTRTFIPHRCHQAIGVLGAVSVASACVLPDTVAGSIARLDNGSVVTIEHPSGTFDTVIRVGPGDEPSIESAGIIRTARKLMDGYVYPRTY